MIVVVALAAAIEVECHRDDLSGGAHAPPFQIHLLIGQLARFDHYTRAVNGSSFRQQVRVDLGFEGRQVFRRWFSPLRTQALPGVGNLIGQCGQLAENVTDRCIDARCTLIQLVSENLYRHGSPPHCVWSGLKVRGYV
ncbi:hypothetical protein FQZ97_1034690 [compost metagenome]